MDFAKKLSLTALVLANSAHAAGVLQPTQERVDFADRHSIAHQYVNSVDGSMPVLCTEGEVIPTYDVTSQSMGTDLISQGATGQAADPITGFRWVNNGGGYQLVGQAGIFSTPINNVTAMAAYNNHLFFVNYDGDFAIKDATTGQTSVFNDYLPDGVGGMSAEVDRFGNPRLIVGNNTEITLYSLGNNVYENPELTPLKRDHISGSTAFGIQGLDFENGKVYTTTLGGTAEFNYNVNTVPRKRLNPSDVVQKSGNYRQATRVPHPGP